MTKFICLIFALTTGSAYAQCYVEERYYINHYFDNFNFTGYCPTYAFDLNGDTSKHWNIHTDPMDINQAPYLIGIKQRLESKIRDYGGDVFFNRLKFYQVEVSYPDSLAKFETRLPKCDLAKCKAKYFFFYYFMPNDSVKYCIGFPLDEKENMLSEFGFPSKNDYKPVDTTLTICKIIELAKKADPKLRPIQIINFDYDEIKKRYYWTVTQKVLKWKPGKNYYRQVIIDAADKTKVEKKMAMTIAHY